MRNFRTTFSHVSAFFGTSVRSACWSDNPPVRCLSLWQATQYLLSTGGVLRATRFNRTLAAGCCRRSGPDGGNQERQTRYQRPSIHQETSRIARAAPVYVRLSAPRGREW